MVLGEQQALRRKIRIDGFEIACQELALKKFLLQPYRQGDAERREPARREGKIGLEQSFEFEEWLVVEHNVVELGKPAAGLCQTIGDGAGGKAGIVLLAGESLLLSGGDDAATDSDRGSAVVIERRDPEDAHGAVRTACK